MGIYSRFPFWRLTLNLAAHPGKRRYRGTNLLIVRLEKGPIMNRIFILAAAITTCCNCVVAQEIDNNAAIKNIGAEKYIRLTVDNDFVTGTDDQYTAGFNVELCY